MNKVLIALVTASALTAFVAVATEVSVVEQQVTQANGKRMQEIAIARIPIETRYLAILQASYKKAESVKDPELQVKIKKEIEIVENNIDYYKSKAVEENGVKSKKVFNVLWKNKVGDWVKFDDRRKTLTSTWDATPVPITINGNSFTAVKTYVYDPEADTVTATHDGNTFYREGKVPKSIEIKTAPVGEEVNTQFGRRIK